MSGREIAEIIAALAVLLSAIFSGIAAIYTIWTRAEVKQSVKTIEHATNGMKDALIRATEKSSFAAGGADERAKADSRSVAVTEALKTPQQ